MAASSLTLIEYDKGVYHKNVSWKLYRVKEIEDAEIYIERNLKIGKFFHMHIIGIDASHMLVFAIREQKSWKGVHNLLSCYFNIQSKIDWYMENLELMRFEDDGGPLV